MRVVFDTNVFISAFTVPGSQGERAFLLARRKRVCLCTSVAILTETAQKLREKFAQLTGGQCPPYLYFFRRISSSTGSTKLKQRSGSSLIGKCPRPVIV